MIIGMGVGIHLFSLLSHEEVENLGQSGGRFPWLDAPNAKRAGG